MITIESIFAMYKNIEKNAVTTPDLEKFSNPAKDTILDETKSVEWNRNEVERLCEEYKKEQTRLRRDLSLKYNKLHDKCLQYIIDNTNLEEYKARRLLSFAYDKHHHNMSDFIYSLDEYIDLVVDLID